MTTGVGAGDSSVQENLLRLTYDARTENEGLRRKKGMKCESGHRAQKNQKLCDLERKWVVQVPPLILPSPAG